jgi:hypothetical protein
MSSATCICKDPNASQFYSEKMPESLYINFTPRRRVIQSRVVSLQKQLVALLLRGVVYDKYLAMFNKQFTKRFLLYHRDGGK